jgi:hypothetical protein
LSGTVAAAGTVIPGGKQTPKVVSFACFLLALLLLLLLFYFGHHPISSTSSSIASSPTTDEAQPITELQIGELQWIGFH